VIAVHLKGTFNMTKHASDHWRSVAKAGGANVARIINTTSGAGLRGNIGQASYAAAKAGIVGLTLVTALEMRRYGVTANAISQDQYAERVRFHHVEIYRSNRGADVAPTVAAWGLPSEPWIYTIDGDGIIRGRLDGAFGSEEIAANLDALVR